ncbi:hypothetical protein [Acutalibacter intestini]|uniref:hypothetical protein n=1 Tax=Acutalibacter intestini TaxID=3093659 RepID=UPI002AC8F836|nr:hypothetical protein [Acutalibacter sp. M00204]
MNEDFTLEDILEEQRQKREQAQTAIAGTAPTTAPAQNQEPARNQTQEPHLPPGAEYVEVSPEELEADTDAPLQSAAPQAPPRLASPPQPEPPPTMEEESPAPSPLPAEGGKKKKKKKRWSLFGKRKVPDFDESEEDMYYGIQLKPIDEYRLDGDAPPLGEEGYKALFDDSKSIDDEVEENFLRLQKERRRRVAETVQSAGMDEQQIAEEFGVVAPMPVTPFAADPYARQHGLDVEGVSGLSDLQKAMLETSGDQTMEIKLNVLNSTIELQKIGDGAPPVSEETVERILEAAPAQSPQQEYGEQSAYVEPPQQEYREQSAYAEPPQQEYREQSAYAEPPQQEYREQSAYAEPPQQEYGEQSAYVEPPQQEYGEQSAYAEPPQQEYGEQSAYVEPPQQEYGEQSAYVEPPQQEYGEQSAYVEPPQQEYGEQPAVSEKTIEMPRAAVRQAQEQAPPPPQPPRKPAPPPRPTQQVPYVENIFQYRSRAMPTHIINANVLQSALLSESDAIQRTKEAEEALRTPKPQKRPRPQKAEEAAAKPKPPKNASPPSQDTGEAIEDYTGPEDARSVANELRGEMHELSLRIMITGVCTVLLTLVALVCRSRFSVTAGSGSWPLAYVILTLVFSIVAAGVCYKTVGNGLKALFAAKANSDSAVAVAVLAGLVQTVCSLFFREDLVTGGLHLYAPVVSALLLANAAGKLTMIRRIHSNFRFVTSREQKYAVKTFDDYNTSLKMTKDCVAEKPLISYQCKTGFLKRFLELSYAPDPSEASSQVIAPLGLICSLVLCIACLLITSSVPTAVSAFSAACCACVAAANMLSVNLPISRMCKTARRAGGMLVGYEAVEKFGDVNAVIADAGDLFPTGTVVLGGIKTFGSRVIAEDAIMCATALMKEIGGPLSGVFDQVINEAEEILPEVEKYTYESGGGIVGRVDGKTIYIGGRGLLINHRLEVPTREEETQYASGNQNIIYIAVDTMVAAILVLSYSADRRRKNELQRLEDSGISVLVRTTDPNVTVALVSRLFGIDSASVGILDAQLGDTANRLTLETDPRADAVAATKGRMESMMSLISACVEQKRTAGILVAIQTAAVVLGFVLVALLACFGGMRQLSTLVLFLFELFWLGLLVLIPKLRR